MLVSDLYLGHSRSNGIGSEGGLALAASLDKLICLQNLSLGWTPPPCQSWIHGFDIDLKPSSFGRSAYSISFHSLNRLGLAGWSAIMDALEKITSLESLNEYSGYRSLKAGGLAELDLAGKRLGVAAARFLSKSTNTLTTLNLRYCVSLKLDLRFLETGQTLELILPIWPKNNSFAAVLKPLPPPLPPGSGNDLEAQGATNINGSLTALNLLIVLNLA